ncbi:MAG TPA: AsmA-like C-terminal region-containing protein [Saprospiraceae bacterium]|nr:AsmA-like C-terminal region-containing protein [Saprospiraceae bacterium]
MIRQKIITGSKIIAIIFLLIAISLVAIIQWKGDAIVKKVIGLAEINLEDSLHYEHIQLEWFSHFPSVALRVDGLTLGPENKPLIAGGNVDVVLKLLPLLKENIVISKLHISNSRLNITRENSRWSYEVFKKSDPSGESNWNALVHQVSIEKTNLIYDDHEGLSFSMDISNANIEGVLSGKMLDANIIAKGLLLELTTSSYHLPATLPFELSGIYKQNQTEGTRHFDEWVLQLQGLDLEGSGSTRTEKGQEYVETNIAWKNGDAAALKQLLPSENIKDLEGFTLTGDTEGQIKINGKISTGTPSISCTAVLKNGALHFPGVESSMKNMLLAIMYENGDAKSGKNSLLNASLKEGSFRGDPIAAEFNIRDLAHPVMSMNLTGSLPAEILNLISTSPGIHFQNGIFDVDHLKISGLSLENASLKTFIDKSETAFAMENIHFTYNKDVIEINQGDFSLDPAGHINFTAEKFNWNKANAEDVKGELNYLSNKAVYKINGSICHGVVESTGTISGIGVQPVLDAQWKLKGVEIKEVMASFDNFDQAFITSENLQGKTDIWAKTLIPYDATGNILSRHVSVSAAIDIKNGVLQNMKTLEDFSKYIHVEDLRDIRFNEFRNYLKIEDGKVYLPVVFLQSNAINLSVNGVHGFDQKILYNLKINAGQAVSNKVRKLDVGKNYKKARKSGWINLYYVLSGAASDVKYEQDRKEVLSGFEQSSALKENLRNFLVDHFGYEVYWLEPNEWEDIPEYE